MVEENILICDTDRTYVEALSRYLLGCDHDLHIHYFTEEKEFCIEEPYGVALLSKEFLKLYEGNEHREMIHHVLHMTGTEDEKYKEYKQIYKFQPMDEFRKILIREQWQIKILEPEDVVYRKTRFIAVYSPISHELVLPFTLLLAKQFQEHGRTLIVDMQENSMIMNLLHLNSKKSLIDYIFHLESEKQKRIRTEPERYVPEGPGAIEEYLEWFEDIAIIPPVRLPTEIAYISSTEWGDLITGIQQEEFQTVLLLFDRIHCGFEEMLLECEQLLLVGKQGGFYRSREEKILKFLMGRGLDQITKQIYLPIAVDPVGGENYQLEGFSQGALGKFIRKQYGEIVGAAG